VNPTTSQNNTEHTRRSATGTPPGPEPAAGAADAGAAAVSVAPQERQKRLPGMTGSPHDGQPPTADPHSPQNRSPASTKAPHCRHRSIDNPQPPPRPARKTYIEITLTRIVSPLHRTGNREPSTRNAFMQPRHARWLTSPATVVHHQ
jgi:hypothetical protein